MSNQKKSSAKTWLELNDAFIPAHWQPAVLLELLMHEGHSSHNILRSSKIFYEDMIADDKLISAAQFQKMIVNSRRLYGGKDLGFRYGLRLIPGHFGVFSDTLQSVSNLFECLELLHTNGSRLSPLLTPRMFDNDDECGLVWYSAFGEGEAHAFFCEALAIALKEFCRSRSGEPLPWQFQFDYPAPANIEHYEVNLSVDVKFSCPQMRMSLPKSYLHKAWAPGSAIAYQRGLAEQAAQQAQPPGFILHLRSRIFDQLNPLVSQESLAQELGLSCATLKRKLKAHGLRYRDILDRARLEKAYVVYRGQACRVEEIAQILGFYDEANLRRSFRRWTGLNPSQYLADLCMLKGS